MNVLVIDDDPGVRRTVSMILESEGYQVQTASDGRDGLDRALKDSPDLILCDVRMPRLDGLAFVHEYRSAGGAGLVIVMTAYGSNELAIEAMKKGAYDYIPKPFEADQVILVLKKAEERESLRREVERLRQRLKAEERFPDIVFKSSAMGAAVELATKVARHPSTVLVTGESGTGKELIARHTHAQSPRADRPFVPVNCGAIPENLLESELFGHARGAFTGAQTERAGLFEEADGGTLFLDEIGDMSLPLQSKILRAIQEREIERVGGGEPIPVDVRLIAATHRDLQQAMREGRFREDLYYRIAVVSVKLPRLTERGDDIVLLTSYFLRHFGRQYGKEFTGITDRALQLLRRRDWVGNVRELRNVIERGVLVADGDVLRAEHLPEEWRTGGEHLEDAPEDSIPTLREMEARHISRVIQHTNGQIGEAARILGVHRNTLARKIKEYNI